MECIIYLQSMAMEYFDCIQSKCNKINQNVLERLRRQLDPFTPIFRPVVSQLSSNFIESDMNDLNKVRNFQNIQTFFRVSNLKSFFRFCRN